MKVGILAVQGDFEAHAAMLARMGVEHTFVRTPDDLAGIDAIILPGGESTTQWKFLVEEGLDKKLREYANAEGAIFGTCAGAILLAHKVHRPDQASLDVADITVIRNGYGHQLASEIRHESTRLSDAPLEMVFIRAPIVEHAGPGVEILASFAGNPVLLRQGRILISTFHPELTSDTTVHEYFLRMARRNNGRNNEPDNGIDAKPAKNAGPPSAVSVEPR